MEIFSSKVGLLPTPPGSPKKTLGRIGSTGMTWPSQANTLPLSGLDHIKMRMKTWMEQRKPQIKSTPPNTASRMRKESHFSAPSSLNMKKPSILLSTPWLLWRYVVIFSSLSLHRL